MPTPQTDSRHSTPLVPVLMTQLYAPAMPSNADWLGHGLIARGSVTLFTSQWKASKTTLLAGLMQQFAAGGKFLDRPVKPAKVLFVSEESKGQTPIQVIERGESDRIWRMIFQIDAGVAN